MKLFTLILYMYDTTSIYLRVVSNSNLCSKTANNYLSLCSTYIFHEANSFFICNWLSNDQPSRQYILLHSGKRTLGRVNTATS